MTLQFLPITNYFKGTRLHPDSLVLAETITDDPSGIPILVAREADGPYIAIEFERTYDPRLQCSARCLGTFTNPCTEAANRITTEDLRATMESHLSTPEEKAWSTLIFKNRTLGAGWALKR